MPDRPEASLNLKGKGDLAELMVAADLRRRGFKVAIPFGENCDFDLKIRRTKRYTAKTIDLLAVYDRTSDRCYYLQASELGEGRSTLSLRLQPALNKQYIGTRPASNYLDP